MYTNPAKAVALAHELADKLKIRFAGKTITESFDTDGLPLITINDGTPAAGEQNILIKVALESWPLGKDVFGNAANVYTPHVIQFATELSATAGETLLSGANILAALGEIILRGCKVEWYMSANGVVPVVGTLVAANLKGTFYPDMYNPLTNQQ